MCIACTVQSRPIFIAQNKDQVTPYEVKDWIVAFLEGFGIGKYSNTTADCQNHMGVFYDLTASGVGNYINSNYYDGTLNTIKYKYKIKNKIKYISYALDANLE